jgi:FkbM family methyltransferase
MADTVRTVRMAVSDRREVLRLYSAPDWNIGAATTHVKIETLTEAQTEDIQKALGLVSNYGFEAEVDAAPLSEIIKLDELKTARVIKIDCEGAEWAIAAGMAPVLDLTRADLEVMIEINPEYLVPQGKTPEDILSIFFTAGFHAYQSDPEYEPQDYIGRRSMKTLPRLRTSIKEEINVIFSRRDVESLAL